MTAGAEILRPPREGPIGRAADALWRRPKLVVALLLAPVLAWLTIVYLGSLLALLRQSFFSLEEFSGLIDETYTLATYAQLLQPANVDIVVRTVAMALCVTLASAVVGFPVAYVAARYARGAWKAAFYLAVMLPLWSSYLVKVYAWKLLLAREGILTWTFQKLGLTWALDALLAIPTIGGPSLSTSYIGTFLVFLYIWLPYMILPTQAALERVPGNLIAASSDLGRRHGRPFTMSSCRSPCRGSSPARSSPSR